MNSPPTLYNLILLKIKTLKYPELIYLQRKCSDKKCKEIIEHFKTCKYKMFKKYRYRRDLLKEKYDVYYNRFNYLPIYYLKTNLQERKVKMQSLKNICMDVLYSKNVEVFKSMKRHLPLIVYRDIEKRIKCRDLVYNLEEETNFLTVNNRNNIVMYRDLLDISLPEEHRISHLKIKKDAIFEIQCKIKFVYKDYIVIQSNKLLFLEYFEKFLTKNYNIDPLKFKSIVEENTAIMYNYHGHISELPAYDILKEKCLIDDLNYKIYFKIVIDKNEKTRLKLLIHHIQELDYL